MAHDPRIPQGDLDAAVQSPAGLGGNVDPAPDGPRLSVVRAKYDQLGSHS